MTDFFNRIGQKPPVANGRNRPAAASHVGLGSDRSSRLRQVDMTQADSNA